MDSAFRRQVSRSAGQISAATGPAIGVSSNGLKTELCAKGWNLDPKICTRAGGLDLSECFIDGTFIFAQQGASEWENQAGQGHEAQWQCASGAGLPLAIYTERVLLGKKSAWSSKLSLRARFTDERPQKLIGDKAYDSDPLDERLARFEIEMMAPHKVNRKKFKTPDGRKLRRYKRHWKIERLSAWLQNFRRVLVRFDYPDANYLGFVHLAFIVILLRNYF